MTHLQESRRGGKHKDAEASAFVDVIVARRIVKAVEQFDNRSRLHNCHVAHSPPPSLLGSFQRKRNRFNSVAPTGMANYDERVSLPTSLELVNPYFRRGTPYFSMPRYTILWYA